MGPFLLSLGIVEKVAGSPRNLYLYSGIHRVQNAWQEVLEVMTSTESHKTKKIHKRKDCS